MSEPSTPRIFVSYARSDGRGFARDLRRRLGEEHGFSLWHDLADMEGGRDWWRQIEAAIRGVEHLVLVMTPAALRSEHVRREWRLARQLGVCVVPVKAAPDLDFASLPRWMQRAHFVDAETPEQWTRFVRTLEGPCRVPRVPFMVEDLPPDFVPRPEEYRALRDRLLDPGRGEPVALTAALRGAGGYGKTTLARALCHDPDIQDAFHDGVLWVTLGEQPGDLSARVEDLIAILTGERPGFASLEASTARLAEALADRTLLLVIDDAWSGAHLRPFLRGGPNCARLITTRNGDTLPPATQEVPVDAMRTAEAVDLLRFDLPDGERDAFDALAVRLGEWPLLLKLVNGALRARVREAGQPLRDALDYVSKALDRRGLTAFDAREAASRHQAVAKTLGVSLDQLRAEERARFLELAVFPEDIDVPLVTVETLWKATAGLDDFDTEELCGLLRRRSLLLDLNLTARRLRLHDVVRRYLLDEQRDALPSLHRRLIEAHGARCPDGWWSGPDDGYFFQHLPWHLAQAQERDRLRDLLFHDRWLRAKLAATSVTELTADFALLDGDGQATRLGAALRLSAHALATDSGQLPSQLCGRLASDDGPDIAALLGDVRRHAAPPSLLPRRPTLTPPGTPLIRMFTGHAGAVVAMAVLSDGRHALSGSDDSTLRLWDLETGTELRRCKGNFTVVAAHADARRALSGSSDNTLRLWDLEAGTELRRFKGHTDTVRAVAMLSDGRRALSGSDDNTLRLWDLESGAELRRFAGHSDWVTAVAVLPDGRRALSGSYDGTLRLWDLESGAELRRFEGHTNSVTAVAVLADGRRALSASDDNTLRLWDLESAAELRCFEGHTNSVTAVAVLADGRRALSGSDDRTLRLWDLEAGAELRRFEGHSGEVTAVAVLADGRRALSGSWDGTLRLWDLEAGAKLRRSEGHTDAVCAMAAAADGRRALSGSQDGTLRLWDLESGAELRRFMGHTDAVRAVAMLSDGRRALSGSDDRTLRLWDLDVGTELRRIEGHTDWVGAVAAFSGGRRTLSGSDDGALRLWDLESGAELRRFQGHTGWVRTVAVLAGGRRALSGSWDDTLRLWDLDSGAELRCFDGHTNSVTAVAVLPDGRRALSGSSDRTLLLWDLDSGTELRCFEGHTNSVTAVAVLPDGRRALSGSDDRTLRLWDLESGALLAVFTGDAGFTCLALTPDGRAVVAGDAAGNVHLLDILLDSAPP